MLQATRTYRAGTPRRVEGMTRDEVCHRFQRKVILLARRLSERLPSDASMQFDDLVSCGAIGLLEAFDRFEPSRGIQFSTFAEYRIRGAMLDALRSSDTFSRRRRQLANRIADLVTAQQEMQTRVYELEPVANQVPMLQAAVEEKDATLSERERELELREHELSNVRDDIEAIASRPVTGGVFRLLTKGKLRV